MEEVTKMQTVLCAPDETFISDKTMKALDEKYKAKEGETEEEKAAREKSKNDEMSKLAFSVKENVFQKFKDTLYERINSINTSLRDKDMLTSQVREMTIGKFDTVKEILTRSCGELCGFHYDPRGNTMMVNTRYSQEGKLLEDMFGSELVRTQWDNLTKWDLNISKSEATM